MKTIRLSAVLLILLIQLVSMLMPWSKVMAQQVVEIQETKVDYSFGGQVTFWAKTNLEKTPERVQIFFKGMNQNDTIVGEVSVRDNELVYVHDLVNYPLPAFSEIQYWFGVKMPGEQAFVSPKFSFYYDDNRYSWQMLEDMPFRVHWYEGNLEFGQMVLDSAQNSLERANQLLGSAILRRWISLHMPMVLRCNRPLTLEIFQSWRDMLTQNWGSCLFRCPRDLSNRLKLSARSPMS